MIRGIDYLTQTRKLSIDTIYNFHLGYIDITGNIYTDVDSSLPDVKIDPRFYDSAMFPIYDLYSNVIGISCRSLQGRKDLPKYINTVYAKGAHLYGFQSTWKDCLEAKKVYVVEGNVDTLQMWQSGIKNVVGMLGSNLTFNQICILSRFVEDIVLVPDGDNAGEKFLNKLRDTIPHRYKNMNLNFKLVKLPSGYDPDKFLQEKGSAEFLKLEMNMFYTLADRIKELEGHL